MKKFIIPIALALFAASAPAAATCLSALSVLDSGATARSLAISTDPATGNCLYNFGSGFAITNPTSTLTLPATTTAYAGGNLIASSATAGSVVVPSLSIANTAGGFYGPRLRLSINDSTSTAWGGMIVQVDLWTAAPTMTNGDRGAYLVATGSANYLASYSCTLIQAGDGAYGACAPTIGTTPAIRLAGGTSVFWTAEAVTGSGVTGASKVFTLTAEFSN
jgi:hypothetical protein